ncbi:hypothetical protein PM10SUCC1_13370 [Propionigenium maris DSM 9537]|uniref:Methyltransferase domain-containing protein n=1 Tax=Propionigenium maris DSM 9537 TaxID=1123000 RepID=A0A9W6GII4_9FUSO|nr:class I SAM-dependent methyltransferase [Propionigenium maris]GLI55823.1 hypothetical protein PM10SUCC1_13370 [Propionigenium maris DSM 9537]
MKITKDFVRSSIEEDIYLYFEATINIGLWESERYVFNKYFHREDTILDIGCGTGRTTLGLHEEGYRNIIGLDLSPKMIEWARGISESRETDLEFIVGDATNLSYEDESFSNIVFSFNGFMQIPSKKLREEALKEIKRVLKRGGYFIFTTHDRDEDKDFYQFWEEEKGKWSRGEQNPRLLEFGDVLAPSSCNENREIFVHIPTRNEVIELIEGAGLKLIEDFYRSDLFTETDRVKRFSNECRFFIVQK